jgi:hypothetical protein
MNKKDIIQAITFFVFVFGALFSANSYLAKASDLQLVQLRLDQKIVSDAINQTQDRHWKLIDRHNVKSCDEIKDERDKEECRKQDQQLKNLEKQYDVIIKKQVN